MPYALGVDIGTTYTAAAVRRDGTASIVWLGAHDAVIPTAVYIDAEGEVLVGEPAARRGLSEPDRLAARFKRRMGDSAPLIVGGAPHSAESLTGHLLRWVVQEVSEREGGPPDEIAVTHPANWGPFKRDRLDQAIRLAGLEQVTTLSEPEAAAIHYASHARVEVGAVIAVYDLGGGTFDAALLRKTDGGFEVLGPPEGIERLGGIDFDDAVFAHVHDSAPDGFEDLDESNRAVRAAVARIRSDCVVAKEALSNDTTVSIPLLLPAVQSEVDLTRTQLEAMLRPPLRETVEAMRRAMTAAGTYAGEVTALLLVGGSSRIPLVAELVGEAFGCPVALDVHPKHAVALGAALAAGTVFADLPVAAPPPAAGAGGGPTEHIPVPAPVLTPVPQPGAESPPPVAAPPPVEPAATLAEPAPVAAVDTGPAPARQPEGTAPPIDPTPPSPGTTNARPAPPTPTPSDAGPRRRPKWLIGAAVIAVAAVAFIGVRVIGGGDDDQDDRDDPDAPVDLATGQRFAVGDFPDGIAIDQTGSLWVASTRADEVTRIDPESGSSDTVSLPRGSDPLAVAVTPDGGVWVTLRNEARIVRFDPESMELTDTVDVAVEPAAFAQGAGSLWVASSSGQVDRIDPDGRQRIAEIPVPGAAGVTVSADAAWVTQSEQGTVAKIDIDTNEVVGTVPVGLGPDDIEADADGALWISNRGDGTLSLIDAGDATVTETLPVGGAPANLVIDGRDLWVSDKDGGTVVLVDRFAIAVVDTIEVGPEPLDLVVDGDRVWVSVTGADEVVEVTGTP